MARIILLFSSWFRRMTLARSDPRDACGLTLKRTDCVGTNQASAWGFNHAIPISLCFTLDVAYFHSESRIGNLIACTK